MKLDEVDDEIVLATGDGWQALHRGTASAIGIAVSTCHARVNALQAAGVIKSFHAEVDLDAVGLPFQALVMVRMRPQGRDELRAFAKAHHHAAPGHEPLLHGGSRELRRPRCVRVTHPAA